MAKGTINLIAPCQDIKSRCEMKIHIRSSIRIFIAIALITSTTRDGGKLTVLSTAITDLKTYCFQGYMTEIKMPGHGG